ncbi:RNA 2',3'-cyclic phosphodiesterase [Marinobacter sp.]|uniref:RNA 2',3'-cyclic phosphodiesterase n=1 Tax=Marinobacter sp. TaxID=50741 RepID=UPI0019C08126|nr:RNA 2',3'-cyclic phosphodiesterase [Marinobacter sp.]MBC7191993.1 RNA 2',3'-cyclic phosphodiesterase [Marinobacter sp.]
MPRLFFGLELPSEIKDRLLTVQSAVPGAKWQSAAQLHLTVLFLGNVEEEQVPAVCHSVADIQAEPFSLQVTGLGCFGRPRRPRNLWAGIQPEAPVARLHKALQRRMQKLGFATENRAFHPHITLARFKRESGSVEALLAEQGEHVFGQFPVTEFVLFESQQEPAGSAYSAIRRFACRLKPGLACAADKTKGGRIDYDLSGASKAERY